MDELVKGVKAYAYAHYEENGWDFLVECWEDKDIAELIAGCKSVDEAVEKCRRVVRHMDEQRKEARDF